MVKQRAKLWARIEEIKECKPARHGTGNKYHLKLLGVQRLVWANDKHLSKDVHKRFQTDGTLVKNAKAYVNRGFATEQQKFLMKTVRVIYLIH